MNDTLVQEEADTLTHADIEGVMEKRDRNRILVGITNYAETEHLEMLLQSIRWYTYHEENFDLVVVDDGTRNMSFADAQARGIDPIEVADRTQELCSRFGASLIELPENKGIPTAWNTIARAGNSKTEIIITLNNDLLMVPNWMRVMVHFLDANKDNPNVASCYFNPIQPFPKQDMRAILPNLAHTLYRTSDQLTGQERISNHPEGHGIPLVESREGAGQGLGRVMCPAGCCFGIRKDVFDQVGDFDERLTSFHEESDWGTRAASRGRASFGFAYPRPYHAHGYTFGVSPELKASDRMRASRKLYRQIWEVPEGVGPHEYFNYTNSRYMSQIPPVTVKFLRPIYPPDAEPYENHLPGGEVVLTPHLEAVEETYEYVAP